MTQFELKQAGDDTIDRLSVEENHAASLPAEGEAGGVDDKTVVVLSTEELQPVPNVSSATVDEALEVLTSKADWLQLYDAVVLLRRVVVHHSSLVTTQQVEVFLRPLTLECDSLRSAPSKNGLLACAECFQFLPRSTFERPFLNSARPEILDVLLRRSTCEKKFLRDAATIATHHLAKHLAGLPLLAACARYGTNKNGKLCATAARIMAASLAQLQEQADAGVRQSLTSKGSGSLRAVYKALAAFRESKDANARAEATGSFRRLGELLGSQELELGLKDAFPGANQAGVVTRILKDASSKPSSTTKSRPQTGSLRDRVKKPTLAQ